MAHRSLSTHFLSDRNAVRNCFFSLFSALWSQRYDEYAGILTGNRIPLYGDKSAAFETFSRLMWGYFPLLATQEHADSQAVFRMLAQGTDPSHPHYWGKPGDFDQRSVEMAVFGLGLAIAGKAIRQHLSEQEFAQVVNWLQGLRDVQIPKNNWSFFPLMVEAGLCLNGLSWSRECVDKHFALLDSFYCGDGWYRDGMNRPCDYYNGMAMHFYGLVWSHLMQDVYPERCRILRERASLFAGDYLHFFNAEGAAIPYGRSMTYRFAQAAFWSAAAWAGLDTVRPGVCKGLVLRHLRQWLAQDIIDARGILTVGYGYANEIMAEDYNAPGSPYWACKTFLILALDESAPFWLSDEMPLPQRPPLRLIRHAGQIVVDDERCGHHYLLNAGQTPGKHYANSESKYAKFAYSSLLGFNLERSRRGLAFNACDSTLLFCEHDDYWRGPVSTELTQAEKGILSFTWSPWPDVRVKSWLIALSCGHLRVHIIETARALACAEGGFPVPVLQNPERAFDKHTGTSRSTHSGYFSRIVDVSPQLSRVCEQIISPPASNIIFPSSSAVPVLTQDLLPGRHVLCCVVTGGKTLPATAQPPVAVSIERQLLNVDLGDHKLEIPL